jgi:hypothetical protein
LRKNMKINAGKVVLSDAINMPLKRTSDEEKAFSAKNESVYLRYKDKDSI